MKHHSGGKVTKSHSSVIGLASEVVNFLKKQSEIKKISLGVIKVFPGGRKSKDKVIKMSIEKSCVLLDATEASTHQTLRFYFENGLEEIEKKELLDRFEKWITENGYQIRKR